MLRHGAVYIQDGRQFLIVNPGPARSPAGVVHRIGQDGKHGLPHVFNQAVGKHRIVRQYGSVVVVAGDIPRSDDLHHPRRGPDVREIDMPDAGMGFFAAAYGGEQHSPVFRLIIHVFGFAAHVQVGALVGQRRACDITVLISGHKQSKCL